MIERRSIEILKHFEELHDPRHEWKILYPLSEMLLLAIIATIAGADGFSDIELYGKEKLGFLQTLSDFKNGIPSEDAMGDLFARLNPRVFENCFTNWVMSFQTGLKGEIVAIDGKCLRRSLQKASGKGPLYLVSAWACKQRISLAQEAVDTKSNEITAIPKLLELLILKGAIVTIDAMGCQKEIVEAIVEQDADYVIALKGNQGGLHEDVKEFFEAQIPTQFRHSNVDTCHGTEKGHGRIERRHIYSTQDVKWLQERHPAWKKLNSIVAVIAERTENSRKSVETRFFISSLPQDAKLLAEAVRGHWGIENKCHWVMDVVFREDECRVRKEDAPENLAIIRKIGSNLIRMTHTGLSVRRARKKAGYNDSFALKILTQS